MSRNKYSEWIKKWKREGRWWKTFTFFCPEGNHTYPITTTDIKYYENIPHERVCLLHAKENRAFRAG